MPTPQILVLFNRPILPRDHPDAAQEYEILETVEQVKGVLTEAGYAVSSLGVGTDPSELLDGLRRLRPDAVFNLFEGLATQGETEVSVAALLEWLKVPFTGSPASAMALGRDKYRTKALLGGMGLPTPPFCLIEELPVPPWEGNWPVIVKPALQDASVGIDQGSVVTNQTKLVQRVLHVRDRYGVPILIEQFVPGREILASVIERLDWSDDGLYLLPLAEIVFADHDRHGLWPIYSYDAKWDQASLEWHATPLDVPVAVDPTALERIRRVAFRAFRLIGCRDYARVDIRLTADGLPCLLEVNPNPFLWSRALRDGLRACGRSHTDFITGLVRRALARGPRAEHATRHSPEARKDLSA